MKRASDPSPPLPRSPGPAPVCGFGCTPPLPSGLPIRSSPVPSAGSTVVVVEVVVDEVEVVAIDAVLAVTAPGGVGVSSAGLQHGSNPSSVAMQAGRPWLSVVGRPCTESQQQQLHMLDLHSCASGSDVCPAAPQPAASTPSTPSHITLVVTPVMVVTWVQTAALGATRLRRRHAREWARIWQGSVVRSLMFWIWVPAKQQGLGARTWGLEDMGRGKMRTPPC